MVEETRSNPPGGVRCGWDESGDIPSRIDPSQMYVAMEEEMCSKRKNLCRHQFHSSTITLKKVEVDEVLAKHLMVKGIDLCRYQRFVSYVCGWTVTQQYFRVLPNTVYVALIKINKLLNGSIVIKVVNLPLEQKYVNEFNSTTINFSALVILCYLKLSLFFQIILFH